MKQNDIGVEKKRKVGFLGDSFVVLVNDVLSAVRYADYGVSSAPQLMKTSFHANSISLSE